MYHIQIGHLPIDADIIRQQTQIDPELKMVLTSLERDKWTKDNIAKLHMYYLKRHELSIEDGIVMWGLRVVVPQCLRYTVLKELHQQHPGIVRMKSLSRMHVWYPNIDKDISELVSHCTDCKRVENEPPKNKHPWAWPSSPIDRIHLDYFGPFYGKNYLVLVDSFSKWCEVAITRSINATSTLDICRNWFSRYGLLNQVITDNGTQFKSEEFRSSCAENGITHITTAPYHQSSNSQAERFVQIVKKGLIMNDIEKGDAQRKLDNYLFAYRTTPSTVTRKIPARIFIGRELKSKLDLVKPDLHRYEVALTKIVDHDIRRQYNVGDNVFIRNYSSKIKWKSGVITNKIGRILYDVKVGLNVHRRHIDQIISNRTQNTVSDIHGDEPLDYEFPDTSEIPRRYPIRNRKPVDRYGIS